MAIKDFPCTLHQQVLTEELLMTYPGLLPQAYDEATAMATLAIRFAQKQGATLAMVPFDCTVEAEALGAPITGREDFFGLRAAGHSCESAEALAALQPFSWQEGRPRQVVEAIGHLVTAGYEPCLNWSGFLTVADMLLGVETIFLHWQEQQALFQHFAFQLAKGLLSYGLAAQEKGCRIFSYSDPLAALSLAGPAIAKQIAKEWLVPFLRQWLALPGSGLLHLCGKSSCALAAAGCVEIEEIPLTTSYGYQQGVVTLAARNSSRILLGQGCLNQNQAVQVLRRLHLKD